MKPGETLMISDEFFSLGRELSQERLGNNFTDLLNKWRVSSETGRSA
ncbi:hypothetical protein [Nostoc sp.]